MSRIITHIHALITLGREECGYCHGSGYTRDGLLCSHCTGGYR